MTSAIIAALLIAATPKVGDAAPDFTVRDIDGRHLRLSQLVQKGPVLLAFFPRAFTTGCARQLRGYHEQRKQLHKSGTRVVAISTDDAKTLRRFRASLGADYTFVSDHDGELTSLYALGEPDGSARHAAFVIDGAGRVLRVDSGSNAIDVTSAVSACDHARP